MNIRARKHTDGPIRVAIYLRQSLDSAKTGLAVARQEQACQEWVQAREGHEVVAVYTDNDVSATKKRKRPGFTAVLADAKAGQFDVILAYHLDRLTRTLRDLLPLLELATEHGVGTTTVSGDLDLTTDMGRMVASILAVVANAEVDRKAARQMLANRQRAEMGKPSVGPRPFGYEKGGVRVRRTESAAIKRAYKALLAGSSTSAIARDLNERGMVTAFGNEWTHHSVRQMLTNARYAGLRSHLGEVLGQATWKPIVDEQTWRSAVSVLTDASRRTNMRPGGERARLLTGIARCGVCDDATTTVVGGSRGAGLPTYRCRSTKHLERAAKSLDDYVSEVVIDRLSRDDARDLLVDDAAPDFEALQSEALAISDRITATRAEFVSDDGKTPAWLRQTMADLEQRQAAVEARMAHTSRTLLYGDVISASDPAKAWDGLSLTRQRAILDALFTVTIHRGKPGGNSRAGARPLDLSTITITERA